VILLASTKAQLSLYADITLLGFDSVVCLINLNKENGFSCSSIINVPLKILCRQCSELTCENPNISLSVNNLPKRFDKSIK